MDKSTQVFYQETERDTAIRFLEAELLRMKSLQAHYLMGIKGHWRTTKCLFELWKARMKPIFQIHVNLLVLRWTGYQLPLMPSAYYSSIFRSNAKFSVPRKRENE